MDDDTIDWIYEPSDIPENWEGMNHYVMYFDSRINRYKYDDNNNKKNTLTITDFELYFNEIEEQYKKHINNSVIMMMMNMNKPISQRFLFVLSRHTQ